MKGGDLMDKKTRNTIVGAAAVLAAAAGTTVAAAHFLSSLAIKRDSFVAKRGITDKISGGIDMNAPGVAEAIKSIEAAKELKTETVTTQSDDGLTLTGHFYPAENTKRIVIAMHGWRSTWSVDYGASYEFYHKSGCAVLYPDQRGTGESDGEYIGFGVLERRDCLCWINYVIERFGTDIPIYLSGVSMGATTVLMALGFELPDCIKGVIADCGFTSPRAIWKHVMNNNLRMSDKLAYPIVNYICNKKAQFDGEEYSTQEALENNEIPVLFIHGGADKFVPIEMTFQNYEACHAEKELLVVPSAGHGMSCVTDKQAYERAVRSFFNAHDGY